MKKATVIVCYKRCANGVSVKNVVFIHRGGHINFPCLKNKRYDSVSGVCSDVLALAKNNHFSVAHYEEFGARWYDILWLNCDTGVTDKYSVR